MLEMEKRVAKDFYNKVQSYLPNDKERESLYEVLRIYQGNLDLHSLINELKHIVNTPGKMQLFEDIRPLIPLRHQMEYDTWVPRRSGGRLCVIRLQRMGGDSLGFSVRGGLEHGVGIYVSHVVPESLAYIQGLRVGDQIVRVNGFTIDQAIHEEVLNLIKGRNEIVLKVLRVGMIPIRDKPSDPVTWKYVDFLDPAKILKKVAGDDDSNNAGDHREVRLFVNMTGAESFGCSICSGPPTLPGIFVQSIKLGSLAEEAGLEVGDQIINVNGSNFHNIRHSEAVVALKSSKQLNITLRRGAGLTLFGAKIQPATIDNEMEEEKRHKLQQLLRDRERRERQDQERKVLEEEERQREGEKRQKAEEEARREEERWRKEEEGMDDAKVLKGQRTAREIQEEMIRISLEQQEKENERQRRLDEERERNAHEEARRMRGQKERYAGGEEGEPLRLKRMRKEFELRRIFIQQQEMSAEREHLLRQERYQQMVQEAQRELKEESKKTPGAQRRPPPIQLRPVSQDFHVLVTPPTPTIASKSSSIRESPVHQVHVDPRRQPPKSMMKSGPSKAERLMLKKPSFSDGHCRPYSFTIIEDVKKSEQEVTEDNFNPNHLFTNEQIAGRQVIFVKIKKDGLPLNMSIEGGTDSPIGGKIVVSEIYVGGAVYRQGGIHRGDQIMMVDGMSLLDITLSQAQNILKEALKRPANEVRMVVALDPPKSYEDEVLQSGQTPTSNLDEFLDDYDSDGTNFYYNGLESPTGKTGVPVTFI
ncbi:harmonin-like isoform X3 [Lineus longissimus]|uniref:harmonin-like isoform X3 n=1 Tax=Lineus longissimus TaxID=88925 RepID=UPI00315D2191